MRYEDYLDIGCTVFSIKLARELGPVCAALIGELARRHDKHDDFLVTDTDEELAKTIGSAPEEIGEAIGLLEDAGLVRVLVSEKCEREVMLNVSGIIRLLS